MTQQIYKNCQNCGMSLSKDTQVGETEKDGTKNTKYLVLTIYKRKN